MPISGKEMPKRYLAAGWRAIHQKVSHVRLEKNGDHETIPVHGNKDLGKGLEHKLLKHLEASK
jgi:predicted RNA binding protein YcfA (HicA-like mRNA interferase family)